MISLENVTKWYPTKSGRKYIFNNLSLKIEPNVNVGVIGRNGAGKSTLIRLLGGSDSPNKGKIRIDGAVSPPFGVSGGLAPMLSGKDNAKFVCRVHGDTKRKMSERLEYIYDFSELGLYFDMPVKDYSSGMRARLAFAISMAFEYDYYLVDELVSVGDQKFRIKAEKAFSEKRGKSSVILVSHNLKLQEQEADVGIYLSEGKVYYFDDIKDAIDKYLEKEVS